MTKVPVQFHNEQKESRLNPGMYSSLSHKWETPHALIWALFDFEKRYCFDLDAACSRPNIPASRHYMWPGEDGLKLPWHGLTFLNPPYGDLLKPFMRKCAEEAQRGVRIWALVPSRTETTYQHEHGLTVAGFTVFMRGRLKFLEEGVEHAGGGGTAPFPTMLLYYGYDWDVKAARWCEERPWPGEIMIPYGRLMP